MSATLSDPAQVTNLSPSAFVQLPQRLRLIDVRSRFEFNQSHAPGAVNLSLPRLLLAQVPWLRPWVLPQWFRELPKAEPIAVICLTAHRSPMAAQQLIRSGFTQVFNITGGLIAWQKARLPIQQGRDQSPLA